MLIKADVYLKQLRWQHGFSCRANVINRHKFMIM